jgi:hypothetical protein
MTFALDYEVYCRGLIVLGVSQIFGQPVFSTNSHESIFTKLGYRSTCYIMHKKVRGRTELLQFSIKIKWESHRQMTVANIRPIGTLLGLTSKPSPAS